jgi:hypothetical protein
LLKILNYVFNEIELVSIYEVVYLLLSRQFLSEFSIKWHNFNNINIDTIKSKLLAVKLHLEETKPLSDSNFEYESDYISESEYESEPDFEPISKRLRRH